MNAATDEKSIYAEVSISESVRLAFQDGLSLPLTVKNIDSIDKHQDNAVIGMANISLKNGLFVLNDISMRVEPNFHGVILSDKAKMYLDKTKGKALSEDGWLQVSPDIKLHLNQLTMHLELVVNRSFFGVSSQQRSTILPNSSIPNLSSLLQYDFNTYTTYSDSENSQAAYLNFKNKSAIGENHLDLDGSLSVNDDNDKSLELLKAMYERDVHGHRFAAGMLDSWSMQELGSVSTLSGSRIYGLSYGNASQSIKIDQSQSLSPIVVYFPSAGEARIFRDGRLLNQQRVSMGNHQLDSSTLPTGVYDVRVDVVVGGKVVSSRMHHVNKMGGNQQYSNGLGWQIWGGVTQDDSHYATIETQQGDRVKPIFGVSAMSFWKDAEWSLSLYQNNKSVIEEGLFTWQINSDFRLDLQNLYSSDSSNLFMTRISYDLPDSIGTVWGYRQRGSDGDRIPYFAQNYDSAGLSLNIGKWFDNAASLSISYEADKRQHNQYVRADYNQMVYSGRYGSAQLQLGATGSDFLGGNQQYYTALNFSVPLTADFQIGFAQQGTQRELNLQIGKSFDDHLINYAGASVSTTMVGRERSSSYGAYIDYAGRYGRGSLSIDGSQDHTSLSLSDHGLFSLTKSGVAGGNGSGDAAFLINVPEIETGELEVVMDNQVYPLSCGRNLIPVNGYASYQVSVRNSEYAQTSYQIKNGQERYTLYPGNIAEVNPEIKQMVTVFGHLIDSRGQPIANATINNHIGITKSDGEGFFSVDVDRRNPILEVKSDTTAFNLSMNFKEARSTMWLGDVKLGECLDIGKCKYHVIPDMG
ncbi:CS1-pili formation C-terminal domain-containing protein [Aeromonas veronii]|uniref:CS1-pili formation C-terminal domain-containing protein n=1 Tax=Aeromonas veronii TaxID=654 RepID=UPI0035BAEF8B